MSYLVFFAGNKETEICLTLLISSDNCFSTHKVLTVIQNPSLVREIEVFHSYGFWLRLYMIEYHCSTSTFVNMKELYLTEFNIVHFSSTSLENLFKRWNYISRLFSQHCIIKKFTTQSALSNYADLRFCIDVSSEAIFGLTKFFPFFIFF
jgi:uncharacterized protein YbcC (UPF0753/DUF2309 family)